MIHSTIKYLSYSLIIALVYYGFGLLVKPFLLPPTFAAPVWPAAGIGVGVLLLWGYRYIPALVVGEFLINYQFYKLEDIHENPYLVYTYIALLISTIIRSALGAFLVKKYVGQDNALLTLQSIIKLFFYSAMIPVTFTAFLSTYVLSLGGLLDSNLFLINYCDWWFGDNIGIYIILPLMFVLFKKPKTIWRNRFFKTFIPVLISFVLLIIIALNIKVIEAERIQDKLETAGEVFVENILADFSKEIKKIHDLGKNQGVQFLDDFIRSNSEGVINAHGLTDIKVVVVSQHDSGEKIVFETETKTNKSLKLKAESLFEFFNHNWVFKISATSLFYKNHSTWLIWWLLSIGFLFISFLESGLLVITGNSILINQRVKKRTKEIISLNETLKNSEEKYKKMIEIQPVMFWKHTLGNNKLDFLSEDAEKIMGHSRSDLMDLETIRTKIVDSRDIDNVNILYFEGAQSLKRFDFKYRAKRKDGSIIWLKDYVTPHYNCEQDSIELIGIKIDITKEAENEQKIKQLAYFDSMTKLPNRQSFMKYLHDALEKAKNSNAFGAILYLDLDRFKVLNDSMGHYFGDQLLKKIALRLTKILRDGDVCSRFGGDEFVVLLQNKEINITDFKNNVQTVANKIKKAMQSHFIIENHNFHTSFSIGISIFPSFSERPDELIQQADIAMYTSKSRGSGEISFFEESMQATANNLLRTEEYLKQAILRDEFEMYYQPIFNQEKQICRLEALIRWHHPEDGLVLPNSFIEIAEESGIIIGLSEWIFDNVFKTIGLHHNTQKQSIPVSINISLFQFRHTKIVEVIEKYAKKHTIDTQLITLELTESIAIDDFNEALKKLFKLKKLGFKLAIDDFGSGYSSLKYLTKMPIDMLKIDKSFVRNLEKSNSSEILVETIIRMAQKLRLDVVAEGVETKEQLDILIKLGCNYFQGFLVNKAMPYKEIEALLNKS